MNYTRVTAHFDTAENAKKAENKLRKKQLEGRYANMEVRNKKVSIDNDIVLVRSFGLKKGPAKLLLQNNRDIVLKWLEDCKGLSYIILVSR